MVTLNTFFAVLQCIYIYFILHFFVWLHFQLDFLGFGGLSLSVEGPSKADIQCKDNEDGTLTVSYKPTEPGYYIVNLKFADHHVPGNLL